MIKIIKQPHYTTCTFCGKKVEFIYQFSSIRAGEYIVTFTSYCEANEIHRKGIVSSFPSPVLMIADNFQELIENAPTEKSQKTLKQDWDIFVRDTVYGKISEEEPAVMKMKIPLKGTGGHFDSVWLTAQATPCGYTYSLRKKLIYEI